MECRLSLSFFMFHGGSRAKKMLCEDSNGNTRDHWVGSGEWRDAQLVLYGLVIVTKYDNSSKNIRENLSPDLTMYMLQVSSSSSLPSSSLSVYIAS